MTFKNFFLATACATSTLFAATVFQNQVGFLTGGLKQIAVLDAAGKDVVFKDSAGTEVLSVKAPEAQPWEPAGKSASLVDFSELNTPGTYTIFVNGEEAGHPVVVSDNAYEGVTKGSLKFFYFQRASTALEEEYAGIYARAAGHPDTAVRYHASTGHTTSVDSTFNGSKGWYDAGDYGKYVVNSGITTYTLLQLYQQNKAYFDTLNLNIPESKNEIPDILDEIRWNLDWMLSMQDADGGVFHKLTTKQFAGMVMPEKATAARFAIGKGIEASWNFAAVLALAADIYTPFDKDFADTCAKAAVKARWWAYTHPTAIYEQPKDVGTGSYTDAIGWTLKLWGNAELFRITGDKVFTDSIHTLKINRKKATLQNWSNSLMLEAFTIATNPEIFEAADVDSAKAMIFTLADNYIASLENNGFGVAMTNNDFYWGSNSIAANKGMVLIHAYILTKEDKYLQAAIGLVDYMLGRNPLDKSYLTGYGVNPVMSPHHRVSQADGIEAPVPGMLSGGPNASANDAGTCRQDYAKGKPPAEAYYDNSCSFASNEVAINWNAPFAYVVGSIQAILATGKAYDMSSKSKATYTDLESIPAKKTIFKPVSARNRLVVKGNSLRLEMTGMDGTKKYYDLRGKKLR
jgi:endoglucanase